MFDGDDSDRSIGRINISFPKRHPYGTGPALSFKSPKEQEYIEFLWDAFETNYTHRKYQFAFLAYHMLAMSFVYFNIWQIKQTEPKDFAMGLIGFGKDSHLDRLQALGVLYVTPRFGLRAWPFPVFSFSASSSAPAWCCNCALRRRIPCRLDLIVGYRKIQGLTGRGPS